MTDQQLIEKYNPANAANLSAKDLEDMRALTDKQIELLAKTYPNDPRGRTYLRLYDTRVDLNKQIYARSTWQNLNNVRKFSNATYLRPYDFILPGNKVTVNKPAAKGTRPGPQRVVVDLSAQEAAEQLKNEITGGTNVDNKGAGAGGNKTKAPTKPAATKGGGNKLVVVAESDSDVDNDSLPDDQQFTAGE